MSNLHRIQWIDAQLRPHCRGVRDFGAPGLTRHRVPQVLAARAGGVFLRQARLLLYRKHLDHDLRFNLFNLYVYIEIGGTGGGSFRPMYARFLKEASAVTGNKRLTPAADAIMEYGKMFTEIALLF